MIIGVVAMMMMLMVVETGLIPRCSVVPFILLDLEVRWSKC